MYNRHPDGFTTSAWRTQNKCVERRLVSEGQKRYLVSYTVAMQPLVSSVTLVSVRSCSDGYSCMHVCTLRHTHFPILASEIVTLSQTFLYSSFCIQITAHFSFFLFPSSAGGARRQRAVSAKASKSTCSVLVKILEQPDEVTEMVANKRPRRRYRSSPRFTNTARR